MGGRLATYENSGKVFLRGFVSSYGGRSYAALQELDSSPLLPRPDSRNYSGYRNLFDYRLYGRLLGNRIRFTGEEIRPLGR